jgi:type III secretion protein V
VRYKDGIFAVFVLAIAAALIVPLPTPLLDLLITLNVGLSFLLLLVCLYIPTPLSLLTFPSILLLSTLFRLALNVASCRLILSNGDAGTVIHAFGTFLIRGELIVGFIIFFIITAVNLLVISRGAGRVAEVAARFALEGLSGNQVAIDSDLRTGLLTAEEAHKRRDGLRQESQLYGAMDGAMRFVQGDSLAGIIIIAANLVGGLYLGVQGGLDFASALQKYSILTVGDGLVSQIPALLTAICAGILVTRVEGDSQKSLGSDLVHQMFGKPSMVGWATHAAFCDGWRVLRRVCSVGIVYPGSTAPGGYLRGWFEHWW